VTLCFSGVRSIVHTGTPCFGSYAMLLPEVLASLNAAGFGVLLREFAGRLWAGFMAKKAEARESVPFNPSASGSHPSITVNAGPPQSGVREPEEGRRSVYQELLRERGARHALQQKFETFSLDMVQRVSKLEARQDSEGRLQVARRGGGRD